MNTIVFYQRIPLYQVVSMDKIASSAYVSCVFNLSSVFINE